MAGSLPHNDLRKALNMTFKLMERVGDLILDCCSPEQYCDKKKTNNLNTYSHENNIPSFVCSDSGNYTKEGCGNRQSAFNDTRIEKSAKIEFNQSMDNERSSITGSDDNFMQQSSTEQAKPFNEEFCPTPVAEMSLVSPITSDLPDEDGHENDDNDASLHAYVRSADTSPATETSKPSKCDLAGRTSTRISTTGAFIHNKSIINHPLGEAKHNSSRPHSDLRRWRFTSTDRLNALIDECERQLNGRKLYVCKFCGKVYEIKSSMRYHMKIIHLQMHLRTSEMQCRICGKQFTCVSAVNRHQSKCILTNDAGSNLSRNSKAYFIPSIINSPAISSLSDTNMSNTVANSSNTSISIASPGKTHSLFSPFHSSSVQSADDHDQHNNNSNIVGLPGTGISYSKLTGGPFAYPALSDTPSSVRVAAAAAALSNMITQGTVDNANAFHAPLHQLNKITTSSHDTPQRKGCGKSDGLSDTASPMQQAPPVSYNCLFPGNSTFESLSNCYLQGSYAIPPPPCGLNFTPNMVDTSMLPWTGASTSAVTMAAAASHTCNNSASTCFPSQSQVTSWSSLNAAVGNLLPSELSPSQLEVCMKAVVRSLQSELPPASERTPVEPKGEVRTESNASSVYDDVTPQPMRSQSVNAANPEKTSLSDEDNSVIDLSSKGLMIESF